MKAPATWAWLVLLADVRLPADHGVRADGTYGLVLEALGTQKDDPIGAFEVIDASRRRQRFDDQKFSAKLA